ncbi:PaaI family thioesterase [Gordonia malaquae]|uniref:PaaI family thioesterase n=1 Tax=Gordonia TaxID=2053 RepID=UPI003019C787
MTDNAMPDVGLDGASEFLRTAGLIPTLVTGTRVEGYVDLDERHHTPWGVVHGGVYATFVESAGSIGASAAVADRGQFAVGVHNATDFLRPSTGGRATVTAEPIQQGRTQQLWLVEVADEATGKTLARGQLRLQNVPLPS